jgi:hypothetical protein
MRGVIGAGAWTTWAAGISLLGGVFLAPLSGLGACASNRAGTGGCTVDAQCGGATPICDLEERVCVQCLGERAMECRGATPVCREDHTCGGCRRHAECASEACLPDGSCGSDVEVAYVSSSGTDNLPCFQARPCRTIASALALSRPYIKLTGAFREAMVIDHRDAVFLADPETRVARSGNGPLIDIKGDSRVEIYDLVISGEAGGAGDGITMTAGSAGRLALVRCQVVEHVGLGISVTGGQLVVAQSAISSNRGGGVSVHDAAFEITNTSIDHNGDVDRSDVGGAELQGLLASTSRFEHNTVVDNHVRASPLVTGGVRCDALAFVAPNNIIVRNDVGRSIVGGNANVLSSGLCAYPTSIIGASLTELRFAQPDQPPYSYLLTAGSSAIDQARTPSTVSYDKDGERRPQGAYSDVGADEYTPP